MLAREMNIGKELPEEEGIFSPRDSALPGAPYQLQPIRLQNAFDLIAGVYGPGAGAIEPGVGAPVFQRFARLFHLFISQRKVIMGVGVGGSKLQRGGVGLDGFVYAAGFI